jgi:hypothetical protein
MKVLLSCLTILGTLALSEADSAWSQAPTLPTAKVIADIDLAAPFGARTPWRFTATQAPQTEDPIYQGSMIPGEIQLCLSRTGHAACELPLRRPPTDRLGNPDIYATPHYLNDAEVVWPRGPGHAPLLLVKTASTYSGDGDQAVVLRLLAYRPRSDLFEVVYEHLTGHNNNQEDRFIKSGPLRGDVISAEPTEHAPFGFWITVIRPTAAGAYGQVLRYRSATRYGDNNPLAVIDSEMPNIERHLGLWRPGAALPLPAAPCAKPHLVGMELWCQ